MKNPFRFVSILAAAALCAQPSHAAENLVPNGDFEKGSDGGWPEGWAKPKEGGSWEKEEANHFLRLASPSPGTNVMLYEEYKIPAGVKALEITWKQRVTGLKVGKQAWFDARILLEFSNAEREKISPTPSAPSTNRDTAGWVEKSTKFLVPEGAAYLKFMPALFMAAAGTFDLDDIVIRETDPKPVAEVKSAKDDEQAKKLAATADKRREKAAELLKNTGNLITDGNFETDKKGDGWPDDWGKIAGGSWGKEDGNRFYRITAGEPGKMISLYRTVDVPAGVKALELTWKQRITNLKVGKMPWFDARIMLEWKDAAGKGLGTKPGPAYSQRNTDGWIERKTQFLVPDEALALVLMPALFQVTSGTFDLDDLVLKPTAPEVLYAKQREEAKMAAARHVDFEQPDKAKWPKELHVVGNRLHDTDDKEVWLQGVNAGGMETLPHDQQVVKSAVVATEDWKANVLRLPVKEDFWFGRSPVQKDGGLEYRERVDQIVTLVANRGGYVVLDLHRFRAPKPEHVEFWKDAAARYKNHPAVLFDLFNEPYGISWDVWKNGGFVGEKGKVDESAFLSQEEKKKLQGFQSVGMQALIDAVRGTGAKNIVIPGGLTWSSDLTGITNGYALDDKGGNGIMYSWHIYNWHKDWEKLMLAASEKYPILVGETGADAKKYDFIPLAAQEDPYTWVPDMLGFIQLHKLNWTAWCLHPQAGPILISDWNYTPTPFWGVMAKDAIGGKKFEMKRTR